jgi:hypothetical protein
VIKLPLTLDVKTFWLLYPREVGETICLLQFSNFGDCLELRVSRESRRGGGRDVMALETNWAIVPNWIWAVTI